MQKLNRRAVMAALAGAAAVVPGVALAAKPGHPNLSDELRNLIAELRSKDPAPDLWNWIDGHGHGADWFTYEQHHTMELIATRLERLIGGVS